MGERTPAETAFLHFLSALCLFTATRAFPHVTGVFLIVVVPPTVPAQLSAAAAACCGRNLSSTELQSLNIAYPVPNGHTYLCRRKAAKARFDNRHSTSAPAPTLAPRQRQRRKRYKRSLNRQCYPLHFMREYTPPNLHDPQRAKGSLNRRFEWFSLVTFFLQKKKVTRAGARNSPSRARRRNTCSPLRQGSLET